MADGTDYLNGSHERMHVDTVGMLDWSEEMTYLQGMYQPLTSLEKDTVGGPATDAALAAEADLYDRHLDAAGFMLDHVYAVEGTISDVQQATVTAANLYRGTDADSAAALAAAERAYDERLRRQDDAQV